jgi:hypothetical protein
MLEKVLGDVTLWCWFHLAAKPSHVGVDVDGLASPLHRPTTYNYQMRGHDLSGAALSSRAIVGCGAFLGDAKPSDLDIHWRVDHLGTCVTEFYVEYIVFTRICLPNVRVIMAFMLVSLFELPFQTVMGRILALECVLSVVRGLLQPCPIWLGNKCYCSSRLCC